MKNTATKDMLGRHGLISVEKAQYRLDEAITTTVPSQRVPLEECLDRITAVDIHAAEDLPAHPRSTMDGFAVIAADTFGATESMPCYLQIDGEVLMGELPRKTVNRGSCFRIATGGLLPPGADSVVMFEHTVPVDSTMIEVVKSVGEGANIIKQGDDIAKGRKAFPAGRLLRPQDLGLLAGLGAAEIDVFRPVNVGILSTGDEIVPYTETPAPGKIRNINSITIGSQAAKMGAKITDYGIVNDREESFFPAITRAVVENDVVIFSGGSSVGTRDLGQKAIEELGKPGVLVYGVALKPGKPILIGLHGTTPIFGLPGHPVSAMVCFDLFVAPAIEKLAGLAHETNVVQPSVNAVLTKNIHSAAGRKDIVRVELSVTDDTVSATPIMGKSGSISTLSRANGYVVIDEPQQGLPKDSTVKVLLY